jgi:hypothetical protein
MGRPQGEFHRIQKENPELRFKRLNKKFQKGSLRHQEQGLIR